MFCSYKCCVYEELHPYTALSYKRDCAELGGGLLLFTELPRRNILGNPLAADRIGIRSPGIFGPIVEY
jgi:hypothetical protein